MSHSEQAKSIQKEHGTYVAARYLKHLGWPVYMTMFVLTGHWCV